MNWTFRSWESRKTINLWNGSLLIFPDKKPWRGERKKKMKNNNNKSAPEDLMMSFFTALLTEGTNLKSSNIKMKEKQSLCCLCTCILLCVCVCTIVCLSVYWYYELFVLPCALVFCWWGLISSSFELTVCCMCACCCMCVCVHRNNTIQTWQNSSLFSFSSCALALLTAIVSPSSFTVLPSERGHGEVLSALFENVITTIIMIVLMMIIVLMKIKGGDSERVSSSWGEATSALWFQGLEVKWRTQRMDVGLSSSSFCSSCFFCQFTVSVCICVCGLCQQPDSRWQAAGAWNVRPEMERSGSSACHMEAGQHNELNSKHGQSSKKEFMCFCMSPWCWTIGAYLKTVRQIAFWL